MNRKFLQLMESSRLFVPKMRILGLEAGQDLPEPESPILSQSKLPSLARSLSTLMGLAKLLKQPDREAVTGVWTISVTAGAV
jgi:hypothetical protein